MNSNRRILPGLKENNIGENIFKNIFSEISKYSSRFELLHSIHQYLTRLILFSLFLYHLSPRIIFNLISSK